MPTEVSREEKQKWFYWWKDRLDNLRERGLATEDGFLNARTLIGSAGSIGYGQGQIRPGALGQWDVFWELEMYGVPYAERILLSGLSEVQVEAEEKRMRMKGRGYNPDDPDDVAEFERLERMTPDERDAYLTGKIDTLSRILTETGFTEESRKTVVAYPGRYLEGRVRALERIEKIVEEGMAQEALAGWVEEDSRREQERQARLAMPAEKSKIRMCRRCNHPVEGHRTSCGASTKKGSACACPGLVR